MRKLRTPFFIITVLLVLCSCKKEYSLENQRKLPVIPVIPVIIDTSGNTCTIEKIIRSDYPSLRADYANITAYTSDHKVSNIQLVDSVNNSIDNLFVVIYTSGRIQVDADQYFTTGPDGKVTGFNGYEYPEDATSDRVTAKYNYNTIGQLVKRTEEYELSPGITSFEMNYTYTGGNLTRCEAKYNNGLAMQTFIDVAYEYETNKTIKNFIYLNAVAPEIFYFQTAINAGATPVSPLKKATTIFKNYNNGQDLTTVSNFGNYSYDTKNRVTSFRLTGDDFIVNNLYQGKKYTITYSCY